MRIRRIHAPDMQTALERVRAALGPDAVIISARPLGGAPEGGQSGLLDVEVVAGVDDLSPVSVLAEARSVAREAARVAPGVPLAGISARPADVSPAAFPRIDRTGDGCIGPSPAGPPALSPTASAGPVTAPSPDANVDTETLPAPDSRLRAPAPLRSSAHAVAEHVFDLLCDIGLTENVAERALEEAIGVLPGDALVYPSRLLEAALARTVAGISAGPELSAEALGGRAVFFIGPAGVGKTTALLKAAVYLRRGGAEVGIIAADISRRGLAEQLQRYGQVLHLSVVTAYDAGDVAGALASASAGRVTLVDTPACSPGAAGPPDDAARLIGAGPGALVVMTVAAGTSESDLCRLTATAHAAGASAVAITKLDEAAGPGAPLNVLAHLRLPLLLCSTGRDVIADRSTGTAMDLAVAVLQGLMAQDETA